MKLRLILILGPLALLQGMEAAGESLNLGETEVILLWPESSGMNDAESQGTIKPDRGDGHVRVTDVGTPSMLYFPATESPEATPAILLCPGGGYKHLVLTKMTPTAKWLNDRGISAFVLKYRTPDKRSAAFDDVQRAIRIVRSRAAEWNIDPEKIGVMGSSAGGHLAARVSTHSGAATYPAIDEADQLSSRPNFTVLLYPAYMYKKDGGDLADGFPLQQDLPPTLMISARDDSKHFKGSEVYAQALRDVGASVRTHFFDQGGHGFALEGNQPPLSTWPDLFYVWLQDVGVLPARSRNCK